MPNLRKPSKIRRKVYGNIMSIIMYGAPVWDEKVLANKTICRKMSGIIRVVALRIIAVYKTMADEATHLL